MAAWGKSPPTAEDWPIKPVHRESDDPDLDAAPEDFVLAEERERNAELARRISDLQAELRAQADQAEETLARTVKEQEAEFAAALRERDEALRERETELKQQLSDLYEKRKAELRKDFDDRQAGLEDQLAALEMRLDVREDELREQAGRREAKLEDRIRELQEQLADAKLGTHEATGSKKQRRRGGSKNGAPDVNEVSFEQLRELGLSVTQSARVVAYRETRGGFDSLEELDEIPGLPKDARGTLKGLLSS
ncbi:MAG TPA: helix-hairpin-helix domain-containing protein [Solirubrobacterales bacterium]